MRLAIALTLTLLTATAMADSSVKPSDDSKAEAPDTLVIQPNRFTRHSTLFGAGYANTYDDYLSPVEYTGVGINFRHESLRMTHWKRVSTQSLWRAHISQTENPVRTHDAYGLRLSYQQNWQYNWHLFQKGTSESSLWRQGLTLRAGLGVQADIGALYMNRSGNNPAQGYLTVALVATTAAEYDFRLWRRPFTLCLQLDAPFLGMMFSPQYGQSYYHIYKSGENARNVVCAWPGNNPTMHTALSLDIPVASHTIRIAYTADIIQATPNHLRQHTYLHAFMLGWTKRFAILKNK